MAPSLQELIDFLLNEVALCGNQGAALSEVLQAIEVFYRSSSQQETARRQTVDHHFKAKVWQWLTRNPEVSVGKDREWNHLSLDDVEKLNRRGSQASDVNGEEVPSNQDASPIRIFVSQERSWYAVTGHEPDETKVPASEFLLLSIIASRKSEGIPQTDLVRISGQDKRSVPKRTDALQKKGYIQKRPIQVKSSRTSLCTLSRFLGSPAENENSTSGGHMIDFESFNRDLFAILRSFDGIVARNDLKKLLGFEDHWRWRVLSRALRKFERIGVLKRVKATSQYERQHPCVMLLREPTPKDMELFNEIGQDLGAAGDDQGELDEDMELGTTSKETPGVENDTVKVQNQRVKVAGRTVPSWNPDRNVNNQIFEIIDNAGVKGITNIDINKAFFGTFFRRPTESMIQRLVDCWQISQPLHLRHLSLVRDTAIEKTIIYYIHYSVKNFGKLVEAGEASWEAVEFPAKKAKGNSVRIPGVNATATLDQYGFPQEKPRGIVKNGKISLFEGLAMCKPTDYSVTSSDPALSRYPDGSIGVVAGHIKAQSMDTPATPVSSRRGRPTGSLNRSTRTRDEKRKSISETPDRESTASIAEDGNVVFQSSTRATKYKDKLMSLPRKERFEAMGMDETWTEYAALVMKKPRPGVYVTSVGKRRPVGKKQGRPRRSQIAVFKSEKLKSLPWFVKEQGVSDDEGAPLSQDGSSTLIRPRKTKQRRTSFLSESPSPPSPSPDATVSQPPNKKPRLQSPQREEGFDHDRTEPRSLEAQPEAGGQDDAVLAETSQKRPGAQIEATQTAKRRRVGSPKRTSERDGSQISVQADSHQPTGPSFNTPARPAQTPTKVHGSAERGGSINILRRKIVMEIVETAGGAYPAGNEIWYPFTTKWMSSSRNEKPDMRTIKTAIKYLIDIGKLRQLTFSGKDLKDVMVTKTLLITPGMSPDDPLVKDMQATMLASNRLDPTIVYSPRVEIDPEITRGSGRSGVHKFSLPHAPQAVVQLQQKPASIVAEEQRRDRKVQRELIKRLAREQEQRQRLFDDEKEEEEIRTASGVKRLRKIRRREPLEALRESGTQPTTLVKPGPKHRVQRLVKKASTIGSHVLLMNPQQVFHPGTGTFGTYGSFSSRLVPKDSGASRKTKDIGAKRPSTAEETASISELQALARRSQGPSAEAQLSRPDFNSINDQILNWELSHETMFDSILADLPYIEQSVDDEAFQAVPIGGTIRFDIDRPSVKAPPATSPMTTRKQGERLKLQDLTRAANVMQNWDPGHQVRQQREAGQPVRRQRNQKPLPEALAREVMVAIVAVRTLAGGTEGRVLDWDLMSLAFPNADPDSVRRHATRIMAKSRLEMIKMQRDFQERYLEAYARGQVPRIDYNHLDQYDWPTVVRWANTELDVTTFDKVPPLPATREQFDGIFEIREEPTTTTSELFKTTSGSTMAHRRDLMGRVPFAVQLEDGRSSKPASRRREELARVDVTKTWVRANVVTPPGSEFYDAAAARRTLDVFGERLASDAAQSLLNESVITASNRGRVMPGRNFEIHEFFRTQLDRKRGIDRDQLRRAVEFKTAVLDPQLQERGVVDIDYHAADGDILALANLSANGRIELRPRNPPSDKFGLLGGAYLTRQMDKTKLRFDIEVRALPSYVYGNPVKEQIGAVPAPKAPLPEDSRLPVKIPLWFGIGDGYGYDGYGKFLPEYWEKTMALVLGCVDARHGVTASEISTMVRPLLGAWEVELLLGWLTDVGLAQRQGQGPEINWMLREWWWMALG